TMLAELHRSSPADHGVVRRGLELPGRGEFERALGTLDRSWDDGPLSEAARRVLAIHVDLIDRSLQELDRLADQVDGMDGVVTHGEPHPGNLIHNAAGVALVDWDTVAVARPERDLWMIDDDDGTLATLYRDLTGHVPEPEVLVAYRLLWALAD